MKVVLFCGGEGLRMRDLSGSGSDIPKPMVALGPRPILWHLMKYYAHYGHKDFVLCLGYKADVIKEFFASYKEWISNDFVLSGGGRIDLLKRDMEDWRITLVDTGIDANIGERLLAVREHLRGEDMFLANYSDGLTDCPAGAITARLEQTGAVGACMLARPSISLHMVNYTSDGLVKSIIDPNQLDMWINAGFFAFRQEIFDYIRPGDELVQEPFRRLIAAGKLAAYPYSGFWRCCDTFKDLQSLQCLLARSQAPWQPWKHPPPPDESTTVRPLFSMEGW
jgi:glucose-1-phosphate cytidylyltransferase